MFDISWGQLIVVGIVALIVIGPKELPGALRGLGRTLHKLRGMAGDFRAQFDDAMREAELHDVAKDMSDIKSAASGGFNPVETICNEIRGVVDDLKGKATDMVDAKEAQASLDDVVSTLRATEYDFKTSASLEAMVTSTALPADMPDTVASKLTPADPPSAHEAQAELPPTSPPAKPRRKKVSPKSPEAEGETP